MCRGLPDLPIDLVTDLNDQLPVFRREGFAGRLGFSVSAGGDGDGLTNSLLEWVG